MLGEEGDWKARDDAMPSTAPEQHDEAREWDCHEGRQDNVVQRAGVTRRGERVLHWPGNVSSGNHGRSENEEKEAQRA